MDASTVVALISTAVAAAIAVGVPRISFRLTQQLDHKRWLREQRALFYVDLLTEAYAEEQWLEQDVADDETRDRLQRHFPDLRLPPLERARLGARGNMFSSRAVNALLGRLQAEAFWSAPTGRLDEGQRTVLRVRIGRIQDELNSMVRREMGADDVLPAPGSPLLRAPHPADRAAQRFEAEMAARFPKDEQDREDGTA